MGMQSYKSEVVGAFGQPIAENPTGVMQEAAFAEAGLNWRYLLFEVAPDDLPSAVQAICALGLRGMNLTIPHKVAVLAHLDEVAADAALIGAVNTIRRDGQRLIGENTDGKGFMRALVTDAGVDPSGSRVVILGAGGAARAIAVELALAGARHVTIVNRSAERGQQLAALIGSRTDSEAIFAPWTGTYALPEGTDVLVQATSIGLAPDVDARPDVDYTTIRSGMTVCDVIPNPPNTPFLRLARERGATAIDGLGMLVYQGAIAFELWTGERASITAMRTALAKAFA